MNNSKTEKWYKKNGKVIKEVIEVEEYDNKNIENLKKSLTNQILGYEQLLAELKKRLKKINDIKNKK